MAQVLLDHQILARVVDRGLTPYFGTGSPAALQVQPQDQWTALLLLSPVEDSIAASDS